MAYVSKELKKEVAAKLKMIMGKGWKYSLAVRHHSTLVLTINSAPIDLPTIAPSGIRGYVSERSGYPEIVDEIVKALNTDNYDNSDSMTDYFDVGHYVNIKIGTDEKPFIHNAI